ncbi:hypothetical protein [Zestomonas thermotolerans]|nr:hypothetical protein [Pseudomonas thermotolerans]
MRQANVAQVLAVANLVFCGLLAESAWLGLGWGWAGAGWCCWPPAF